MTLSETRYVSLFRPSEESTDVWEVRAMLGAEVIGRVRLRRMTECVAVGVAFALVVSEDYRRNGIALHLMAELERTATRNRITLVLSTIRDDNPASQALVARLGFAKLDGFNNPKSGADVHLYSKSIPQPAPQTEDEEG